MELDDTLVTLITNELLKRLHNESFLDKVGGVPVSPAVKKPPLVLIGGITGLQPGTVSALESRYDIRYQDGLEGVPDDALVLVTSMSIRALVRLAQGDDGDTPEGAGLLWALLRGKQPVIREEGMIWRTFSARIPPALADTYRGYERKLGGYGVQIVNEAGIPAALGGVVPPSVPVQTAPAPAERVKKPGKRVITEMDLIRECPPAKGKGQSFEMGPGDILTPLARDYVSAMHIDICGVSGYC
jgi:hypothetical protein